MSATDEERWLSALERGGDLRPVRPENERAARDAVRLYLHAAASSGDGPVGFVADPCYLRKD